MSVLNLPNNTGIYKRVAGADPAANTECSDAVPAGKLWVVVAYSVQLVQGATQTPLPVLTLDDGTTIFYQSPGSSAAQAAASTAQYTWANGMTITGQIGATPGTVSVAPLADFILFAGYRVRTVTQGIGANTNFGAPSLYVIELTA